LTAHDPNEMAWLHGHAHDPNPTPPGEATAFVVTRPGHPPVTLDVADLHALPLTTISDCYIVSTGHGRSGPFRFGGVRLLDLLVHHFALGATWQQVDVVSADGFGARIPAAELLTPTERPILLAYAIDGQPLTRNQGLVRLIVPSEIDDALRQVKWVAELRLG
jgi:DMSO/TMAO reductase YedYZ molybdopterin-dependent catalytic subunit